MKLNGVSKEDIIELKSHSDDKVRKLAELVFIISEDLEARMFTSTANVINKICEDMDELSEKNILRNLKDDKQFERINLFIRSIPDYSKNIQAGLIRLEKIGVSEKTEVAGNTNIFLNNKKA